MIDQTKERIIETENLQNLLKIVRENIEYYTNEKINLDATVKELYDAYHQDNPELISELYLRLDFQDMTNKIIKNNIEAARRPYFGRVSFDDFADNLEKTLYIGRRGISDPAGKQHITDWRAPVSSIYYENSLGDVRYTAPEGEITVGLKSKRTFDIQNGRLVDFYDSEVITNDELLQKYLSRHTSAVLGEIIATIQKDQNEIIRSEPWRNVMVQGSAGSGKTTVAMHRIAYLLYNFGDTLKSNNFYILGSNKMFLSYITGSLPDLDVSNVNQMTVPQFLLYCLDMNKIQVRPVPESDGDRDIERSVEIKSSMPLISRIDDYVRKAKSNVFAQLDIVGADHIFLSADEIETLIDENAAKSFAETADMLDERLLDRFRYRPNPFMDELNERSYKGLFRRRIKKLRPEELYRGLVLDMLESSPAGDFRALSLLHDMLTKRHYDIYDLSVMLILFARIGELEGLELIKHIVLDEAQDFGEIVIYSLFRALKNAKFTIIGDVSQNISKSSGLTDWEHLRDLFFNKRDRFFILNKSYRNTIEISNYAARVLKRYGGAKYPVEPIIRHGNDVDEYICENEKEAFSKLCKQLEKYAADGYAVSAVICRDVVEAQALYKKMRHLDYVSLASPDSEHIGNGVTIFPAALVKGLEFDAVAVWNAGAQSYGENPHDMRLLYVALTRALHELSVFSYGGITPLLSL